MSIQVSIQEHIDKFGHSVMGVFGDQSSPPFSYTVGLTETYSHPEILTFGLSGRIGQIILNDIVSKIKEGAILSDGSILDDVANMPCAFKSIPLVAASEYAFQAIYRYENTQFQPSFLQMVIPDRKGAFPWEKGYDVKHMGPIQPELWKPH